MATQGYRRALGQHFLKDQSVIDKITSHALNLTRELNCKTLIEIGPGRGALTNPLLAQFRQTGAEKITLVERDPELADFWKTKLKDTSEAEVICSDFIELSTTSWLTSDRQAVVSNLPYSAGTAIVVRLARFPARIPVMVLMFQAEVAKRIRAERGTKDWGSLSLFMQNNWDVTPLMTVSPKAFRPPPKVQSEVIVLRSRKEPRIALLDEAAEKKWDKLLKTAFTHRRKMLRSGVPAEPYGEALKIAGIDGTLRAEALNWDQWAAWFKAL